MLLQIVDGDHRHQPAACREPERLPPPSLPQVMALPCPNIEIGSRSGRAFAHGRFLRRIDRRRPARAGDGSARLKEAPACLVTRVCCSQMPTESVNDTLEPQHRPQFDARDAELLRRAAEDEVIAGFHGQRSLTRRTEAGNTVSRLDLRAGHILPLPPAPACDWWRGCARRFREILMEWGRI